MLKRLKEKLKRRLRDVLRKKGVPTTFRRSMKLQQSTIESKKDNESQ
ncbi:hypothetical protein [Gracilibacillus halophilus]|nr:hypothetical protein [Gracilibacillus halophilus]